MNRLRFSTVVLAVAAAALVVPASLFAQADPPPRGGAGTNLPGGGAGGGGDRAVSRPDSGGGSAATGGSTNSGGGSGWSGNGSGNSGSGPWIGNSAVSRRAATAEAARIRSEYRGENGGRRYGSGSDAVNGTAPWYSRNREGRPIVGTAAGREEVGRPGRPGGGAGDSSYWSYGYGYYDRSWYNGRGYYSYPWQNCRLMGFGAYGMGYFFYDPYWWSYGGMDPGCGGYYQQGLVYPGYYGYGGSTGGYWGGTTYWPDYGGGGGGDYAGESSPGLNASLKLKVKPSNAQVFIDGYFAGSVDDFDGAFQKLPVRAGEHRLEFRAPGYDALIVDVRVGPYEILNYKAELKRQ